jgi:hypothetical protein
MAFLFDPAPEVARCTTTLSSDRSGNRLAHHLRRMSRMDARVPMGYNSGTSAVGTIADPFLK